MPKAIYQCITASCYHTLFCYGVSVKSGKRVYKSEIHRNASQIVSMLLVRHSICTVLTHFGIFNAFFFLRVRQAVAARQTVYVLRQVRATIAAVENQEVLRVLSMCL